MSIDNLQTAYNTVKDHNACCKQFDLEPGEYASFALGYIKQAVKIYLESHEHKSNPALSKRNVSHSDVEGES